MRVADIPNRRVSASFSISYNMLPVLRGVVANGFDAAQFPCEAAHIDSESRERLFMETSLNELVEGVFPLQQTGFIWVNFPDGEALNIDIGTNFEPLLWKLYRCLQVKKFLEDNSSTDLVDWFIDQGKEGTLDGEQGKYLVRLPRTIPALEKKIYEEYASWEKNAISWYAGLTRALDHLVLRHTKAAGIIPSVSVFSGATKSEIARSLSDKDYGILIKQAEESKLADELSINIKEVMLHPYSHRIYRKIDFLSDEQELQFN